MCSLHKFTFTAATAIAFCAVAFAALAQAPQNFPTKAMRLVVGSPPGSQIDMLARTIGQKVGDHWAKPVVVENRASAGETLAATTVVKAVPDGHTLLLTTTAFLINAALYSKLPYDPINDFAGVTQLGFSTLVLIVPPSLGVKSVQQLVALSKDRPNKVVFAFRGAGSGPHLVGEDLIRATGISAVRVAFKGGAETQIEVMAGRAQFALVALGIALPHIQDGKLLAVAVNTPDRSPLLPEVPTLAETLPGGFRKPTGSYGLLAPVGTPRHVVNQISSEVARIFRLSDVMQRLTGGAIVPAPTTPEEYDNIRRAQIQTFAELTRAAGLRAR
jgi:tripartite-type tricarboxylate transporter receptor subunit TctC